MKRDHCARCLCSRMSVTGPAGRAVKYQTCPARATVRRKTGSLCRPVTSIILTARLSGYLAMEARDARRRPGVLVFHEGRGLGDFAMERARRLAALGYVAFAADMFGERRQARDMEEARALIGPLRGNPA